MGVEVSQLPSLSIRHRQAHDPYWGLEGPAARHERRRRRAREGVAFGSATIAVVTAVFAWCVHLGLAHVAGLGLLVRPF
jgi:hypothetical protein